MESWYHDNLHGDEKVAVSDSGYTNSELAMEYLQHFIQHTPSIRTKLLIMDSHVSHEVPEFIILAHQHNIHLHVFPSHLTHILQPLDVTVFAQYKHWHRRAIQQAIRNFDTDYNVISFFRDLSTIRKQTFTKGNCIKSFRDAGIWPPNYEKIQEKVAIYAKPEVLETPQRAFQASYDLSTWSQTFDKILSSPSRQKWASSYTEIQTQLTEAELFQSELVQITTIMTEQRQRKVRSRKSIQKGGAITVEHARQRIYEKKVKEQLLEEAREKRERTRMVNVERKMQLRAGIDARKAERTRKKDLHEFQKSNPDTEPPIGLRTEIIDPDVTQKKREEEEEADRLLAIEESGYVNFAGLDYDMIHDASDGGCDDQSLPDNIDPNLF
jgi:hypothetical protein